MSSLCILEINPLSDASFANIFSHSDGCLFVLFMVSGLNPFCVNFCECGKIYFCECACDYLVLPTSCIKETMFSPQSIFGSLVKY